MEEASGIEHRHEHYNWGAERNTFSRGYATQQYLLTEVTQSSPELALKYLPVKAFNTRGSAMYEFVACKPFPNSSITADKKT